MSPFIVIVILSGRNCVSDLAAFVAMIHTDVYVRTLGGSVQASIHVVQEKSGISPLSHIPLDYYYTLEEDGYNCKYKRQH
jgi:hypothetical protein